MLARESWMPDRARHDNYSAPAAALRHRHDLPACIFHPTHHPQPFRIGAFRNAHRARLQEALRLFVCRRRVGIPGRLQHVAHQIALHRRAFGSRRNGFHQQQPGLPRPAACRLEFDGSADVVVDRQAVRHPELAAGALHLHAQCVGLDRCACGPAPAAAPGCRGWRRRRGAHRRRGCPARSSPGPVRRGRGLAVSGSLQQDSQSALMNRSTRAAGCGDAVTGAGGLRPGRPAAARRASNGNGES